MTNSTKAKTRKTVVDVADLSDKKPAKAKRAPKANPQPAPEKPKPKRGRPTICTVAVMDEIIHRIGTGEPLRQICRDDHMPSFGAVYDWLETDKDFSSRFARARERGEEAIAQECLDIADNATNDWMVSHGQDSTGWKLNGEHVQRSKIRIDTRLKLLAKWNPKKWGEKVDLNHGIQPEDPLATLIQRVAGTGLPVVPENED